MMQVLKEPLLQFLIIGAGIYGVYALYGAPEEDAGEMTIVVDVDRIESFVGAWQKRWNRLPARQELDGLINAYVREDIFYRQAVAMGLNENDPITRRRLAQKLEFLTKDIARLKEPTEGELEQYFQDNQERYRAPDLITFNHVFLDPDKRGAATLDDAAVLLAQLQATGKPDATTLDAGDRFMLQSHYQAVSELEIRRQMGSGFSAAVMQLVSDQWHGPVLSGYGVHLVYVNSLDEASPPVFADARQKVLENWQTQQQKKFNTDFFESLKSNYEVVIAEVPDELVLDSQFEGQIDGQADASVDAMSATDTKPTL
jgi:hypothetical protein